MVRETKAEALQKQKDKAGEEYADIYDIFTDETNPLTDTFTVTYEDNDKVVTLAYVLNQIPGVYRVNNRMDLATTISSFKQTVLLIFTWFLLILSVVTLFVIINTIKVGTKPSSVIMQHSTIA